MSPILSLADEPMHQEWYRQRNAKDPMGNTREIAQFISTNIIKKIAADDEPARKSALEFDAGAAYSLTPHWSLALEFENERGFDGMVLGCSATEVSNPYFLGPAVQYADGPLRIVFGVQAQLPVASNPTHALGAVVDGFTADAERFRAGLRLAREL